MKKYLLDIFEELNKLENILLKKAYIYKDTIMPGFTHMRSAMPSSFGFWWQSYLDQALDLYKVLKSIFEIYDKFLERRTGQEVHFELGRALVAQCGSLISRILYVKNGLKKKREYLWKSCIKYFQDKCLPLRFRQKR